MIEANTRGHLIAMIGEYIGTTMLYVTHFLSSVSTKKKKIHEREGSHELTIKINSLFFGYAAAQTANQKSDITLRVPIGALVAAPGPSLIQISYISSIFGLSLMTNVFVWYRVSGGMFNPSISFGLWLAGAFNWVRLVCVVPMQILGAITAAGLVSGLIPGPLQAENSVGPGVSVGQGFVMEAVLTAMLMITILMLAVEKSKVSFMAPMGIGIALLIIHLVGKLTKLNESCSLLHNANNKKTGINVSGASVNPARTLGVAFVNRNFVPEIWIYVVAPTLGAAFMAGVHALLKALAYQTGNGGQDSDGQEYYRVLPPSGSGVRSNASMDSISQPKPMQQSITRRKDEDERALLRELK